MTIATRRLGRTGRVVSELGFGCGGFWASRWMDDATAIGLVHQAIQLGITVFDAGHSYGGGRAEERLGRALQRFGPARNRLMISTKVGTVRLGRGYAKDFSPDTVEAQVVESMDRLGLERIPLLFLHGPEPAHLTDDLLDTLAAMKGEGAIDLIGINGVEHQISAALDTGLFDVIMPFYNPVHRRSEAVIERAAAEGLGVMAAGPLARMATAPVFGSWSSPSAWWYAARHLRNRMVAGEQIRRARQFAFLNALPNWSAAQASLAFTLTNPAVHCAVFGTTDAAHLQDNAAASGKALPDAVLRRIRTT